MKPVRHEGVLADALRRAGLLGSTGRAAFRITARGTEVLTDNPPGLTVKYLMRFADFQVFPTSLPGEGAPLQPKEAAAQTPEEILESSYRFLRHQLASDLLERARGCTPGFFESLVLELLVAMGYGGSREDAAKVGRTGDGGIDGIIKEDKLGLDAVYVQAKRWRRGRVSLSLRNVLGVQRRGRAVTSECARLR